MEIRHLRYFAAVASELHFARAAQRLNISPPTLTQQIKWLESNLGVQLFIRSGTRKVELTFAGKQFQKRALALIESFEQTERSARQFARGEIGDVRLGYVLAAATAGYMRRIIEVSRAKLPNVVVHIHRMETLSQMRGIEADTLDIGIVRGMDSYPTGIEAFVLPSQRFGLAMHRDHPLAARKQITPAMLANQEFIAYELDAEVGYYRNVAAVLPPGAIPRIVQRVPDAISVLTLVSANVGIAIVPESFKTLVDKSVLVRNISGPPKYSSNVLVYRTAEASPAVKAVTQAIRTVFAA